MPKDINSSSYSEETQLKLSLFRDFFREWFSVFVYNTNFKRIFVYDLFAGSGCDSEGEPGSPLLLIEEAKGKDKSFCPILAQKHKSNSICFAFNELKKAKLERLNKEVEDSFAKCRQCCSLPVCPLDCVKYNSADFQSIFKNERFLNIMRNPEFAKFLLLDQYGFSLVDDEVFRDIVAFPKTDFAFFISSSNIKRFINQPAVQKHLKIPSSSCEGVDMREMHRIVVEHFKELVPQDRDYFIHGFAIKKMSNYWGIVFGSSHSYGMEKIMNVCWKYDRFSGESNYNIDNDAGELFYNPKEPFNTNKNWRVFQQLKREILSGKISTNIQGLKRSMFLGCQPKLFMAVLSDLLDEGKVSIEGKFSKKYTKIHTIEKYQIRVHENDKN